MCTIRQLVEGEMGEETSRIRVGLYCWSISGKELKIHSIILDI